MHADGLDFTPTHIAHVAVPLAMQHRIELYPRDVGDSRARVFRPRALEWEAREDGECVLRDHSNAGPAKPNVT